MNQTPSGNRIHIGFFGRRNAGKSSLVNAVTGQNIALVSDVKGTTTDPVYKAMELLPLGPVMIIDTPGLDDEGQLGELRIQKAKQVLRKIDVAIVVVDVQEGITNVEKTLLTVLEEQGIPFVVVWNKCDLLGQESCAGISEQLVVSAMDGTGIEELKERIPTLVKERIFSRPILRDLLQPLDLVVLVVPLDEAAPKGRLILPQQQVIREVIEAGAIAVVVKDTEYESYLKATQQTPRMVVTDSQVFGEVSALTPENIPLTSFSILMARHKGFLKTAIEGVKVLHTIKDGDYILIAEGCTHHRQCGDIGTVKLPNLIRKYTSSQPEFSFASGVDFPEDLSAYKLVIHCGGCMLNEREMHYRERVALEQKVPFTNYGIAIAHMKGILERSLHALDKEY